MVHVNNAVNFMLQQYGNLEKRVQESVTQVWGNQSELKGGMDSAEFNLRTHQKVLNALAIEFERLVTHLNDEVFKTEHEMVVLELADVTLPPVGDEVAHVVRRLDWPYYHEQVERDLRILAEREAWEAAEDEQRKLDVIPVPEQIEEVPLPPQDNIPEGATVFGG